MEWVEQDGRTGRKRGGKFTWKCNFTILIQMVMGGCGGGWVLAVVRHALTKEERYAFCD